MKRNAVPSEKVIELYVEITEDARRVKVRGVDGRRRWCTMYAKRTKQPINSCEIRRTTEYGLTVVRFPIPIPVPIATA